MLCDSVYLLLYPYKTIRVWAFCVFLVDFYNYAIFPIILQAQKSPLESLKKPKKTIIQVFRFFLLKNRTATGRFEPVPVRIFQFFKIWFWLVF